jgi:hypothetical protein
MDQPDKPTIDHWHRWFAVECNNRAWDLTAQPTRTPGEEREMLTSAYAAAYHWSQVGQPINDARADTLLAHVHALLGEGGKAMAYARRCLEFCEANECESWDLAFSHLEVALAAAGLGETKLHRLHHQRARQLGDALQEAEEREYFDKEFARIPVPVPDK